MTVGGLRESVYDKRRGTDRNGLPDTAAFVMMALIIESQHFYFTICIRVNQIALGAFISKYKNFDLDPLVSV